MKSFKQDCLLSSPNLPLNYKRSFSEIEDQSQQKVGQPMNRKDESEEKVWWAKKVLQNMERTNMLVAPSVRTAQSAEMKDEKWFSFVLSNQNSTAAIVKGRHQLQFKKMTARDDFLFVSSVLRSAMNFSARGFWLEKQENLFSFGPYIFSKRADPKHTSSTKWD